MARREPLTTKEPLAFEAYLPDGRDILRTDKDESKLLLFMSVRDGARLQMEWDRLTSRRLYVSIVPADELRSTAKLRRGGWGKKHAGKEAEE